jgi:aspartyl-tRNA(Asn)/glutamyl-tRNA(Gln) amidotransferase subunit C
MFKLSDEEAQLIVDEFELLDKQLSILNEIDTEGVEEMIYPFDVETSFLREDEVSHVLDKELALSNATKVKEGHIVVPKVVK